ncbi:MAG: cation:proton antiporter domain-containing protein [Immundisolibacter sp.]|uniref:cation:proton antiporter domain-containing protein n=1 Tax=Immundisolibacter sp. TaxID=1934948 RepID=UPI003EE0C6D9
MHGFFGELVIILTASAVVLAIFHRFRLPPTLGYLATGLLIGPGALGLIGNREAVQSLAEFGVVFLLFSLGLEFSLSRLLAMRRLVFGLGGAQVLICTLAFMGMGLALGVEPRLALLMAAVLALSSTAVVTRELARAGELYARHGQLGIAVLLFQDLAAVLFLILIPALANEGDGLPMMLAMTLAKGTLLFAFLIGVGKWVLPRVFFEVAKTHSEELFVLAALLVALLAALLTETFGLSMTLGAFIAGMMLGESHFRHRIEIEIRPFRDVLLGIFFVSVGMLLVPADLLDRWPAVLGLTAGMLLFKTTLVAMLGRWLGEDRLTSWRAGLLLAQGGEFAFALLAVAGSYGMVEPAQVAVVAASVVLSMALTPVIVRHNGRIAAFLVRDRNPGPTAPVDLVDVSSITAELSGHVIICGYGRVGQAVGRILSREGVEFAAVDEDPVRVQEALLGGERVFYGDARRPALLQALGITRARLVVVSFTDHRHSLAIVRAVRERVADLPILVRTVDDRHRETLKQAGATAVVPETFEASLTLASHVLALLDFPMERVQQSVQGVREERYSVLRGYFHGQRSRITDVEGQELDVRHAVPLPEKARAVGRRLADLDLAKVGAEVRNVRRDGAGELDPLPGLVLEAGDVVVLFGTASQVENAERRLLGG